MDISKVGVAFSSHPTFATRRAISIIIIIISRAAERAERRASRQAPRRGSRASRQAPRRGTLSLFHFNTMHPHEQNNDVDILDVPCARPAGPGDALGDAADGAGDVGFVVCL